MTTLSDARPARLAASSCPAPFRILLWATWFGIVSGVLELAIFLLKCHFFDARNYNVSRHFPWMFPVSGLIVVGGAGALLALAVLLRPNRVSSSAILIILSFFAYLGLLFRLPIYTVACLSPGFARAPRSPRAPVAFDTRATSGAPGLRSRKGTVRGIRPV